MIYVPVDVNSPIQVSKHITVMSGLTNNFPEIVFELHDGKKYFDLGDNCVLYAVVETTDLGICLFTGTLELMNPHRGQILCRPVYRDFSMTGINTLTVTCYIDGSQLAFKTTIFVQSSFVNLKNNTPGSDVDTYDTFAITVNPDDFIDGMYSVTRSSIRTDSDIHVTVPNNITTDEYNALAFANIVPEDQTGGK